jgi:hypothetical protein
VGSIITFGTHEPTNAFASNRIRLSKRLLAGSFVCILSAVNPGASHDEENDGRVASIVIRSLHNTAKDFRESDNVFESHVLSRLSYALLAISSLVARAIDGVIGVIAAFFSLCIGGYSERLNNLAIECLTAPGVINDVFCCAIKFINPWEKGVKFGKTI